MIYSLLTATNRVVVCVSGGRFNVFVYCEATGRACTHGEKTANTATVCSCITKRDRSRTTELLRSALATSTTPFDSTTGLALSARFTAASAGSRSVCARCGVAHR